mmetsp:Transcript_22763/g.70400  ORF Transcript_22763/g.70400 Transcript_22763/m.70400 type:complete len:147 (-) Transcript_22763:26-466(-)
MTTVRRTPLKGNCLYATHAYQPGEVVVDEEPLFRSRLADEPDLAARVAAAHARTPFGFQHSRSHLAALQTLRRAPEAVVAAILEKAAPIAPAAASNLDAELSAILDDASDDRAALLDDRARACDNSSSRGSTTASRTATRSRSSRR